LLDSQYWKMVHADAQVPFHLEGEAVPTSRSNSRRTWISTADGVVDRVTSGAGPQGSSLSVDGESRVSLRHSVSRSFELGPLLGRRVRITVLHVSSLDAGLTQTLTIAGYDGNALLIAHSGEVSGLSHVLGDLHVYVALSQRPGGPMAFGTSRLQSLVRKGDHIRVRDDDDMYVMEFESRRGREATYAIGIEDMWRGPPSTTR
jgi:hypothetical protein